MPSHSRLTDGQLATLKSMWESGDYTTAELSQAFGFASSNAVWVRAVRHGWTRSPEAEAKSKAIWRQKATAASIQHNKARKGMRRKYLSKYSRMWPLDEFQIP